MSNIILLLIATFAFSISPPCLIRSPQPFMAFKPMEVQAAELKTSQSMMGSEKAQTATQQTVPDSPTPATVLLEWYERNPWVAGRLHAEGSPLDEPVIYTPSDQNFFLHRDLDGNPSEAGSLFLAEPWKEGNNHALIYGHNMKNDKKFGMLLKYSDAAYGLSHPTMHFDTLKEEGEYELLGAFYSEIFDVANLEGSGDRAKINERYGNWSSLSELDFSAPYPKGDIYEKEKSIQDGNFRYYYYTDLSSRKDFDHYVSKVKELSLYDTGRTAEWGDKLLTLSTCSYHKSNGRFAVVFVQHHKK